MKCPLCDSPAPHMHPAVQHEGEVEICVSDFHLKPTPQNADEYRRLVLEKRSARGIPSIRERQQTNFQEILGSSD